MYCTCRELGDGQENQRRLKAAPRGTSHDKCRIRSALLLLLLLREAPLTGAAHRGESVAAIQPHGGGLSANLHTVNEQREGRCWTQSQALLRLC